MEKSILDYFVLIRKKLWMIALFVLLSCLTTFYVSKTFVEPVYKANTQVLVSSTFKSEEKIDLNDVSMNMNLVESYKEIIKSDQIIQKLLADHPEFGMTQKELLKNLKVSSTDKTQIIKIEMEDPSYEKAVTMTKTLADTFMSEVPSLMNMNNVKLLSSSDPAVKPLPANASIVINLALSFVLSAMAAIGVFFFFENINDTIRSEKEAEHIVGLPVLASIGTIKKGKAAKSSKALSREVGEQTYVTAK
ncbi:Wzz/FepE/Etk N-terminal domain-containing protein [Paenibacillus chondroitinus]|uniref:Wzz/FepE/Etk N-terminal domain-containing protein n=1 Tax=Paenibacillus chondroitinus TaxID=59842 RepID=A0ABU6D9Z5_9BACL|nr:MULTISPECIES: Wzz/FepE/Etk N-terminal domain-containing protein [Paenibacillus]MCY9656662.1 Wzz/FepE/Etk N-terminal domain-containing protein [Paenibacillus anseongense]MEB4794311.1 Wzz/FepE/Etk N-terminal domain-containing protein [Paenibacillus chondroitinus]